MAGWIYQPLTPAAAQLLAAAASDPVPARRVSASPQQTDHRSVAGYAVVFAAAAALFTTPDSIAAAQYTGGTHHTAIAQAQPKGWVKGTPSGLMPQTQTLTQRVSASPQIPDQPQPWITGQSIPPELYGVQFVSAAPQSITDGSARVWGKFVVESVAPADSPPPKFWSARGNQVSYGSGAIFGTSLPLAPAMVDIASTYISASQDYADQPPAFIKRSPLVEAVVGSDTTPPRRVSTDPQALTDGWGRVWGTPPASVTPDEIGGVQYTGGTHHAAMAQAQGYGVIFGRQVVEAVVAADTTPSRFVSAHSQEAHQGTVKIWGSDPNLYLVDAVATFVSAGHDVWHNPQPALWGKPVVETVIGTDTTPPKFILTLPQAFDYGQARTWGTAPESVVPPVIPPAAEQTPAGRHKRPRWFVEIDGQTFQVASREDAIALLEQAKRVAEKPAKAAAAMAVRRALKAGLVPKPLRTPKIASEAPELQDIVVLARDALRSLYDNALLEAEVKVRLAKQQREDYDDDDDVLLLM